MANLLYNSNYELRPVLAFMFKSSHFYESKFIGCKVKSPIDLTIGTLKSLGVSNPDFNYLADMLRQLQQSLFNPPNVKGWEGQRKWISAATYPARQALTDSFINGKRWSGQSIKFQVDSLAYARSFSSSENAAALVNDICLHLIRYPLSSSKKTFLLNTLLDGSSPSEWSTNNPMAGKRISNCLIALMRLPEYQLC